MENKLSFEVQKFDIMDDVSDEQFAFVEVYVCHDGNNAHNMPISLDSITRAKDTLKNKFLVAGYNGRDFKGHEKDEMIVGFFPESSKMRFEKIYGRTFLVAEAIMSKIYAKWAYDIFVQSNKKDVSMEITVLDSEEHDGMTEIKNFVFSTIKHLTVPFSIITSTILPINLPSVVIIFFDCNSLNRIISPIKIYDYFNIFFILSKQFFSILDICA